MVSGSDPGDPKGGGDDDEDLLFAQDPSLSGQFVQQWKSPILAPEAALQGVANNKLRRAQTQNKSPNCSIVNVRDSAFSLSHLIAKARPVGAAPP